MGLFDDIGEKIKKLAIAMFVAECFLNLIIAIACFVKVDEVPYSLENAYRISGFVFLLLMPFVALTTSYLVYGFGQLIENSEQIVENTNSTAKKQKGKKQSEKPRTKYYVTADSATHKWRCEKCDAMIEEYPCTYCGYEKK